jgi:hypothetical protein
MASRRETEQSKSKDAEEEVIIFFARSMSVAMLICIILYYFIFFEFLKCDKVFFTLHLQVETREEQNKKWEETRAGRVDSWRSWTSGKRKRFVREQCLMPNHAPPRLACALPHLP